MDKNGTWLYDFYLMLVDEKYGEENRKKFADVCERELSAIMTASRLVFKEQYADSQKHR